LKECRDWLVDCEKNNLFAAIVEAPLLFESKFNYLCDYVIAVVADIDVRVERVIKRDNIGRDAVLTRIKKQHDDRFFIYYSDFTVYNNPYDHPELQIDVINQMIRWV
jgi:dephospho-CoA kinase